MVILTSVCSLYYPYDLHPEFVDTAILKSALDVHRSRITRRGKFGEIRTLPFPFNFREDAFIFVIDIEDRRRLCFAVQERKTMEH